MTSVETKENVSSASIEKELKNIWHHAAQLDNLRTLKTQAHIKAILANIVIVTSPASTITKETLDDVINDLCVAHPSRFFIINYQPDLTNSLMVSVSSRCMTARSGSHICSEEIYFNVNAKGAEAIPNLFLSLLVPEVPVQIISLVDFSRAEITNLQDSGGLSICELVMRLASFAERVCYDSSLFEDYLIGLKFISQRLANFGSGNISWPCNVISGNARDLTWQRVRRWRYLIAELFDSSLCLDPKRGVEEISFIVNNNIEDVISPKVSPEVYLLLGWIMDKLEWKLTDKQLLLTEKEVLGSFYDIDGRPVKLCINKAQKINSSLNDQLRISGITMIVRGEVGHRYAMEVRREIDEGYCEIETKSISGKQEQDFCEYSVRRIAFPRQSLTEIVLAEVTAGARSRNFGPAYRMALLLAERLKF
ncbi:MAG: glucose-6-phosphate dehydrogenase assembly protein OpcA [Deltaproteobacteria bacterium]|nr:glucose-6-phosphate dehydrogenase assembly protein OpcA [Deltaproteobacteria bacterium]